jgi:hypothetical protein
MTGRPSRTVHLLFHCIFSRSMNHRVQPPPFPFAKQPHRLPCLHEACRSVPRPFPFAKRCTDDFPSLPQSSVFRASPINDVSISQLLHSFNGRINSSPTNPSPSPIKRARHPRFRHPTRSSALRLLLAFSRVHLPSRHIKDRALPRSSSRTACC